MSQYRKQTVVGQVSDVLNAEQVKRFRRTIKRGGPVLMEVFPATLGVAVMTYGRAIGPDLLVRVFDQLDDQGKACCLRAYHPEARRCRHDRRVKKAGRA